MPAAETFRVNYYVGALLAQGGNLRLEESKLVFSPTSALDRAMGAKDVEIPFEGILNVYYSGALSRTFVVKTDGRTHRFEGAQVKRFFELLQKSLPERKLLVIPETKTSSKEAPAAVVRALNCDECHRSIQPGYSFCPYCGTALKSVCGSCHKSIDVNWAVCAFCGWKFTSSNARAA